jgi:hypothetical protein
VWLQLSVIGSRLLCLLIPESSSTHLRSCLYIIQAYVILNASAFLSKFGPAIVRTCQWLLNDMKVEGIVMVVKLFTAIVRAEPVLGCEVLEPILLSVFGEVYRNNEFSNVTVRYLALISRILLSNQMLFSRKLEEMQTPDAFERILQVYLSECIHATCNDEKKLLGKFDSHGLSSRCANPQISGLALTSLLTVPNKVIYDNFSNILYRIGSSLIQIMKDYEGDGVKTE